LKSVHDMGSSFAPNHIGMPLVSPKLKLDFRASPGPDEPHISGGLPISVFMGGLNYQIEHHLFPSMARPQLRKAQPLVAANCPAQPSMARKRAGASFLIMTRPRRRSLTGLS
jgi:hypothetical protein